jgi:hypothetical protein
VPSILQPVDPNEQFKLRRLEARRRRHKRRLMVSGALLALIAAAVFAAVFS